MVQWASLNPSGFSNEDLFIIYACIFRSISKILQTPVLPCPEFGKLYTLLPQVVLRSKHYIFPIILGGLVSQSCLTLCDPMDWIQTTGHLNPKHINKQKLRVQYLFMVCLSFSLPASLPPFLPLSFPLFLLSICSFFSFSFSFFLSLLISLRWNFYVMNYPSPKCPIQWALTNAYSCVTKPLSRPRALLSPHKVSSCVLPVNPLHPLIRNNHCSDFLRLRFILPILEPFISETIQQVFWMRSGLLCLILQKS